MSKREERIEAHKMLARFWIKVDRRAPNGCWNWIGGLNGVAPDGGYGRFKVDGRFEKAHRVAYMLLVGPIPEGLVLDHLCKNIVCVNPAHLEPVTQRENALRGDSFSGINARKTHCVNGHPFSGENVRIRPDGRRRCMACQRMHDAAYKERRRALAAASARVS